MEYLFTNRKDLKQLNQYIKKAEKLRKKKELRPYLALCHEFIAFLESTVGLNNEFGGLVCSSVGSVYYQLKEIDQSITYLETAEQIYHSTNQLEDANLFTIYDLLSQIYMEKDHRDKCLEYMIKMSKHPKLPPEMKEEFNKIGI